MALAASVREFIRHEGLSHLPRVALKALKPLDFHIFVIQRGDSIPPISLPAGATIYENALERLRGLRSEAIHSANEFWRDRVNGAVLCATIECGGELAGVGWVYEYPAQRPLLVLAPGAAELSGFFVLPKFRGRGFNRALIHAAIEWRLQRSERLFAVAASDNPSTMKAIPAVGFHAVGVIRRRSIGGPKFTIPMVAGERRTAC